MTASLKRLNLPKSALLSSVAGAVIALAVVGSASADVLPSFTLNPSAAGLNSTSTGFTADNFTVTDYAKVALTANGAGGANFTESGYLPVGNFQNSSGQFVDAGGLNSTYGLYFQFNGTGSQSTLTATPTTTGSFNTLSYTLYGYNGAPASFTPDSTTATNPTILATGGLIDGSVGFTPNPVTPTAAVVLSVNTVDKAFFVSPNPFYTQLFENFTNTQSQVSFNEGGFTIAQGGGTGNFNNVPEPASLALLGGGLLALGLVKSRRKAG